MKAPQIAASLADTRGNPPHDVHERRSGNTFRDDRLDSAQSDISTGDELYKIPHHTPVARSNPDWFSISIHWFSSSSNSIALASLTIALASVVYARNSAKISKRSYDLAELQDSRRDPRLKLYLSDAYSFTSGDHAVIAISITLSNPTDIDNSIARAELGVTYHRKGGQPVRMSSPSLPAARLGRVLDILDGERGDAGMVAVQGGDLTPAPAGGRPGGLW